VLALARISLWACAVLFPCVLLARGNHFFHIDWVNHIWLVGHFVTYIRDHGVPPLAFNTPELGGVAYPVFYGYLGYPFLGYLGALVGVRNAIRLAVVALLALQFVCVRRAVRGSGQGEGLATAAACLVVWGVYQLSNLYSRGALTEFFAAGLLTCAVCRWFALLDAETRRRRVRAALEVGLLYTLAAGCHPITAVYGLTFLALLSVTVFLRADRATARARLVALLPAACLTILVLAPWVFAYQTFKGKLDIAKLVLLFKDSIDLWWVRLFPLPLAVRTLRQDPDLVSTPHLDAQIGGPLILLAAAVTWKLVRARPPRRDLVWAALPVLGGMFFLWMSLDGRPYKFLPSAFRVVQFPYRIVTYVNLSALVALLLVCRLAARAGPGWGAYSPAFRAGFLSVLLTLAGTGVVVKLVHVKERAGHWEVDYADLPRTFYGRDDYATPSEYALLGPEEAPGVTPMRLEVERHAVGRYTPATVELEKPGFVGTQVQPFPWNEFYLDGERVPDSELRTWPGWTIPATDPYRLYRATTGPLMAVPVPAGRHILEHRVEPDRTWLVLYWVSLATTLLWALLVIALRLRQTHPIPSA
jgi:hypothetical protein